MSTTTTNMSAPTSINQQGLVEASNMSQSTQNVIASPMQSSSIVTNVVNNFLIGDVYISVRNEEGTEITQIHPVRIEEVHVHSWDEHENTEDYMVCYTCYCKFKINGRMTHPMSLDVFPSLFHDDWNTLMTFHLMPYNFQVLSHVDGMQSIAALEIFINSAFPDISKTTVHNYEALKTGETVGIKRKREN